MAEIIGETTVDVAKAVRPLYIRVRYKHLHRARLALWLLTLACHLARRLGVAVYVTTNEWVRVQPRQSRG